MSDDNIAERPESAPRIVRRRRITIQEALNIAKGIMDRAEAGRLEAAEDEAKRTFDEEID